VQQTSNNRTFAVFTHRSSRDHRKNPVGRRSGRVPNP
jgi:hypothetical protein